MIRVTIEMHPRGDASKKYLLGTMDIANDGGTVSRGDYVAWARGKRGRLWKGAAVQDFPRKRLLVWDLMFRVLREMCGERNA